MSMDSAVSPDSLLSLLGKFQGRKLLVIGDLILSRFVEVQARKLAREAPVPAGDYVGENFVPGGGANLARELSSLGASASVLGAVGEDEQGVWLKDDLVRNGISTVGIVTEKNRPTSLRTWIMVNRLHYLRIDREVRKDVSLQCTKSFLSVVESEIGGIDCVVLSDYDKGVITPALISGIVQAARKHGKIVVAQTKMRHYLDFAGVTYLKSNIEEATHATGINIVNETTLRNLGVNLLARLDCKGILITRGEQGMTVFEKEQLTHFPPLYGRKNFFSKVGVRDAMTACFALTAASGGNIHEAACLSNIAGAIRSEIPRTMTLTVPDLEKQISQLGDFLQKIVQAPVSRR
jgi:D-beta-D-heptose 7-phosphate kinase/D-beta-D-heptose 1-phosphate adenosyltransferase